MNVELNFGEMTVESVWRAYIAQVNGGYSSLLEIPAHVYSVISDEGITKLKELYSRLIAAPVISRTDHRRQTTLIVPLRSYPYFHDCETLHDATNVPSKKTKIKRPSNSFIIYRQYHYRPIQEANPGITNNEISKIIGKQWREEDPSVRARYKRKAEQLKAQHLREHPDYAFQPRKPGEKKRRMTRRQKEALAAAMGTTRAAMTETAFSETEGGNLSLDVGDPFIADVVLEEDYDITHPPPIDAHLQSPIDSDDSIDQPNPDQPSTDQPNIDQPDTVAAEPAPVGDDQNPVVPLPAPRYNVAYNESDRYQFSCMRTGALSGNDSPFYQAPLLCYPELPADPMTTFEEFDSLLAPTYDMELQRSNVI